LPKRPLQGWRAPGHVSDVDRYAQLLQNLAVGIGATREALEERAFGPTLPTAATLNSEFEIITSAIYAAADRPRLLPVTDDKPTARTHFVYRIDIWTDDGKNILEHLAGMENLIVARDWLRVNGGPTQGLRCARVRGS
jgi:hypothetical protein